MVLLFAQISYYILFCSGKTAIVSRGILLYNLQIVVVIVDWLALDSLFIDYGFFRTESVILSLFFLDFCSRESFITVCFLR